MNKPHWNELVALFMAALASLLFEITVTKIFSFSVWSNYAYLVISTAMFGFGFSGVMLTRWRGLLKIPAKRFLPATAIGSGVTMFLAFLVLNNVPIHLPTAPDGWGKEILNVCVVFLGLAVPFTFFGLLIAYILDCRARNANTYYFADLIGAGLGAFMLVPLITFWEPQGLVTFCALISIAAGFLFRITPEEGAEAPGKGPLAGAALFAVLAIALPPFASDPLPIKVHVQKRSYLHDATAGAIEKSAWSALSHIDISPMNNGMKRVWIDAGVNESSIPDFDGDFEKYRAGRDDNIAHAAKGGLYNVIPHLSKKDHSVAVIGTSGGQDSMLALGYGARHITGIEMDPMIAHMDTVEYAEFNGNMWNNNDYMELVVDEGRSYIKRTTKTFDVIQQVNNFTPIAMQNGALNLSESYLLTVESFAEFYDKLTDDGVLCISRWGAIKLVTTAVEMFRQMGMKPEEYRKHIVAVQGVRPEIYTLMVKKSPWTEKECQDLVDYLRPHGLNRGLLVAPFLIDHQPIAMPPRGTPDITGLDPVSTKAYNETVQAMKDNDWQAAADGVFTMCHQLKGGSLSEAQEMALIREIPKISHIPIYHLVVNSETPEIFYRHGPFDFTPPTDDKPFFNHLLRFGAKDTKRKEQILVPHEILSHLMTPRNKIDRRVPQGDLPPVIILIEAIVLSSVFFGLPLFTKKELRQQLKKDERVLGYFGCLGIAFILVEVCLMKRLVLFLGAPVYSISAVLGALLVSAGLGSLLAARFQPSLSNIKKILWGTAASVIALHFLIPVVTEMFLGYSFTVRMVVAVIIMGAAGLVMGMPMPTGIRYLKENGIDVIPWAWAMNGYFTVIGTALTVILAVNMGFTFVFFFAAFIYAIAPFFVMWRQKA